MVTDDVKQLLTRLNDRLTQDLESAVGFAVNRNHHAVTVEHLLLKVLDTDGTDLRCILAHFDVDAAAFEEALLHDVEDVRTGTSERPSFAPRLLQLVESALLIGTVHHGVETVRSGTLLAALLRDDAAKTSPYRPILRPIRRDELRDRFHEIVDGSVEAPSRTPGGDAARDDAGEGDPLDRFTTGFTQKARDGTIDRVVGRNEEIRQVTDVLSRRRKNNPILVGEAGVGKTAIVEGLARRIVEERVREPLSGVEIHALDLGALKAGARVQGEFEDRLKSVLRAVREASVPTILFIDEAHTLIGAGGGEGTGDAANLLKPALARGTLRAIAATTWSEYKQYLEQDPALERRFQRVSVEEPSVEETAVMLRGIKSAYEAHHGVPVTDAAVEAAAELAGRYISGRQLPDKAVDLLDTAAARVNVSRTARPGRLDDLDHELQNLDAEIDGLRRDLEAGLRAEAAPLDDLVRRRDALQAERDALRTRWQREKALVEQVVDVRERSSDAEPGAEEEGQSRENGQGATEASDAEASVTPSRDDGTGRAQLDALRAELDDVRGESPLVHGAVTPQVAAEVVSDWTGIPVGTMLEDEAELLLNLEDRLGDHVFGQDDALHEVAQAVRTSKADLAAPDAPLGVFLFVGPSGVGKTETARRLADLLFGGEQFLTTLNMSEYQEKHAASQLKGSPPGYVGYGEGGVLTEAVRRRPYSVVLLDEVEKAHRDVLNLFYQVFDQGVMRDGEGRTVDFRNTIIIMTSNLAAETITRLAREREDPRPPPDEVRDAIHPTLVEHFQPALLGRMSVVPYYPLDAETLRAVTERKLADVEERLQHAHDVDLSYAPDVVAHIAERCTHTDAGARYVDRVVNRTVLPRAAQVLLPHVADGDSPAELRLALEDGEFACTVP